MFKMNYITLHVVEHTDAVKSFEKYLKWAEENAKSLHYQRQKKTSTKGRRRRLNRTKSVNFIILYQTKYDM